MNEAASAPRPAIAAQSPNPFCARGEREPAAHRFADLFAMMDDSACAGLCDDIARMRSDAIGKAMQAESFPRATVVRDAAIEELLRIVKAGKVA